MNLLLSTLGADVIIITIIGGFLIIGLPVFAIKHYLRNKQLKKELDATREERDELQRSGIL